MTWSDDEAPEEIALSTGRSQAATLRSQEQAQRKQQSAAKRKRKRNDNGNVSDLIQRSETPAASGVSKDEAQLDYIPDEVIEALTAVDKYEHYSRWQPVQCTTVVEFHCAAACLSACTL